MAYSIIPGITEQGNGNLKPITAYYELDRNIVINQPGAVTFGVINIVFRGEEITVFAALDGNDELLNTVALPCPPYYHTILLGAEPGVFISPNE